MSRITTEDESWGVDQETKQQSSQWKSSQFPKPTKAWQIKSATTSMSIVFLCHGCCVLGVDDFYYDILRRLHEDVCHKRLQLWYNRNLLLLITFTTWLFLVTSRMIFILYPPYSSDLAPCGDLLSIPKKWQLKRKGEVSILPRRFILNRNRFLTQLERKLPRSIWGLVKAGDNFEGDGAQIYICLSIKIS